MTNWMNFLYRFPQAFEEISQQNNDVIKPVVAANQQVNKIEAMIENHSQDLDTYKS